MALRAIKKDELTSRLEEALSSWHLLAFTSSPAATASATVSMTALAKVSVSLPAPLGTGGAAKDDCEASALGEEANMAAVVIGAAVEEQILRQFSTAEDAARSVEAKITEVGQLCHQYQEDVAALQHGISVSVPSGQVMRGEKIASSLTFLSACPPTLLMNC